MKKHRCSRRLRKLNKNFSLLEKHLLMNQYEFEVIKVEFGKGGRLSDELWKSVRELIRYAVQSNSKE